MSNGLATKTQEPWSLGQKMLRCQNLALKG
jgi:hypothetical protein